MSTLTLNSPARLRNPRVWERLSKYVQPTSTVSLGCVRLSVVEMEPTHTTPSGITMTVKTTPSPRDLADEMRTLDVQYREAITSLACTLVEPKEAVVPRPRSFSDLWRATWTRTAPA